MTRLDVKKLTSSEDRTLPVFAEIDEIADRIRDRAHAIFSKRGFSHGHALDDWLTAEREVCWPAAELEENDDNYEITVALAGFDSDEISVTATPDEIVIKADHESETSEEDEKSVTHWSEFHSNKVFRRFELPSNLNVDKVSAQYKDGMLSITAPKQPVAKKQEKKVKISTAA